MSRVLTYDPAQPAPKHFSDLSVDAGVIYEFDEDVIIACLRQNGYEVFEKRRVSVASYSISISEIYDHAHMCDTMYHIKNIAKREVAQQVAEKATVAVHGYKTTAAIIVVEADIEILRHVEKDGE